jgi:hypothetical protein
VVLVLLLVVVALLIVLLVVLLGDKFFVFGTRSCLAPAGEVTVVMMTVVEVIVEIGAVTVVAAIGKCCEQYD